MGTYLSGHNWDFENWPHNRGWPFNRGINTLIRKKNDSKNNLLICIGKCSLKSVNM